MAHLGLVVVCLSFIACCGAEAHGAQEGEATLAVKQEEGEMSNEDVLASANNSSTIGNLPPKTKVEAKATDVGEMLESSVHHASDKTNKNAKAVSPLHWGPPSWGSYSKYDPLGPDVSPTIYPQQATEAPSATEEDAWDPLVTPLATQDYPQVDYSQYGLDYDQLANAQAQQLQWEQSLMNQEAKLQSAEQTVGYRASAAVQRAQAAQQQANAQAAAEHNALVAQSDALQRQKALEYQRVQEAQRQARQQARAQSQALDRQSQQLKQQQALQEQRYKAYSQEEQHEQHSLEKQAQAEAQSVQHQRAAEQRYNTQLEDERSRLAQSYSSKVAALKSQEQQEADSRARLQHWWQQVKASEQQKAGELTHEEEGIKAQKAREQQQNLALHKWYTEAQTQLDHERAQLQYRAHVQAKVQVQQAKTQLQQAHKAHALAARHVAQVRRERAFQKEYEERVEVLKQKRAELVRSYTMMRAAALHLHEQREALAREAGIVDATHRSLDRESLGMPYPVSYQDSHTPFDGDKAWYGDTATSKKDLAATQATDHTKPAPSPPARTVIQGGKKLAAAVAAPSTMMEQQNDRTADAIVGEGA